MQESKNEATIRFTVGGRRYAIPAAEVERVLTLQKQAVSPIPFGLGKRMEGLFSFRGAALPLVRIAGAPSGERGDKEEITAILLGSGAKRFGIAVDYVSAISDAADPDVISVCAQSLYEGSVAGV